MKYLPKTIFFFTAIVFSFVVLSSKVLAATFSLTPSSGTKTTSFSVDVMLSPETDKIDAVDVILTYDTTKLDVLEISDGDFEQYLKKSFNKAIGKIEISALNATAPAETTTNVAKITFLPIASGSTEINFLYTPGAVDDTNALEKGIESLTAVSGGSYTLSLGGSGVGTTTPPVVTAPVGVGSTTPVTIGGADVPETGSIPNNMYMYIVLSALLTAFGLVALKKS